MSAEEGQKTVDWEIIDVGAGTGLVLSAPLNAERRICQHALTQLT